ncbi:MAG: hypothetical protein JSV88_33515 [Candidatus Aminicenantes bacterium]|nr:MAG: hypothetical protein JSV88_33515 [Candidatus Aminicenantes bacterium]
MSKKKGMGLLEPAVWSVEAILSNHEAATVRGGNNQTNTQQLENGDHDIPQ